MCVYICICVFIVDVMMYTYMRHVRVYGYVHEYVFVSVGICVIIRELRAIDPKSRTCASSRDPFGKLSELRGGTL